jgi:hypothetical protein
MVVRSPDDVERYLELVGKAAADTHAWLAGC